MKLAFAVALVLASVFAACGDSETDETGAPTPSAEPPAEVPVVEITKTDDGFEAPDSIPGGLTKLRVHNAGAVDHAVHLVRDDAVVEGGTGNIPPGGTTEVVLDLEPGSYEIVRFVLMPPQTRALEVTAAPDERPAAPESAFTVRMTEFAYQGFPDSLPAGATTVEVVNGGTQLHEMWLRRVNEEGATAEQVGQHLNGTPLAMAPTYSASGGMGHLEPGDRGWVTLELEPGVYALICNVYDRPEGGGGTGTLHFELGMNHAFTVQ